MVDKGTPSQVRKQIEDGTYSTADDHLEKAEARETFLKYFMSNNTEA